jgi:hypothetical protein
MEGIKMFKKLIMAFSVLVMAALFCACGSVADAPLDNSVSAELTDGSTITFSTPKGWANDELYTDWQGCILALKNDSGLFLDVFNFGEDETEYSAYVDSRTGYYEDSVIGDVETIKLGDLEVTKLGYSTIDNTVLQSEGFFYGFEYIIDAPDGVVNVDVYRSYDYLDENQKPSDDELVLLQRIAESMTIE